MSYDRENKPPLKIEDRVGYVKTWRKTLDSQMYKHLNAQQRDVFWACLLLANYQQKEWEWEGEIFQCEPGQFITSLETLNQLTAKNTSKQNIRTALLKLEKWGFLTNKSTRTGRLITVCNWESYQNTFFESNKATNKALTKHQQSTNKALTTTKNIKKDKNIKNNSPKKFSDNTLEFKMVDFAIKQIKKTHPHVTFTVNTIQKACSDFEKLMRIDKKTKEEIREVLLWLPDSKTNGNGFSWKDNVQSPLKFRQRKNGVLRYDQLVSAMKKEQKESSYIPEGWLDD